MRQVVTREPRAIENIAEGARYTVRNISNGRVWVETKDEAPTTKDDAIPYDSGEFFFVSKGDGEEVYISVEVLSGEIRYEEAP